MLFNSYEFIVGFLPLCLLCFHLVSKHVGITGAAWMLVVASLAFYASWKPPYVFLILASIGFNFSVGRVLTISARNEKRRTLLLWFGIIVNIAVLGYFKYWGFIKSTLPALFDVDYNIHRIILPLAISFFTFTQIAYLVDCRKGNIKKCTLVEYCFFVLFFPHLIAGPIVRHSEIIPQVERLAGGLSTSNLAVGMTVFAFGLFKKVCLADPIGAHASRLFAEIQGGFMPDLTHAWGTALSYTCQLYFDFSGYSDMAIGLGLLFGVKMPLNFDSPYQAGSIIDFWRRWHISLSRFLKDFIYIPLGGSRRGEVRRYLNLFLTMLIGGIWHGAGWLFLIWGALHGGCLIINHLWRTVCGKFGSLHILVPGWAGKVLTMVAIVFGWVVFRSPDEATLWRTVRGMSGMNGIVLPGSVAVLPGIGHLFAGARIGNSGLGASACLWLGVLLPIAFFAPNTQQIMYIVKPALQGPEGASRISWKASWPWAIGSGCALLYAFLSLSNVSEFIYFQF